MRGPEVLPRILIKSYHNSYQKGFIRKMEGEGVPKRVQEAKDARLPEYGKLRRMERKLQREILEDPGKRPSSPEPMFPAAFPERYPLEQGE